MQTLLSMQGELSVLGSTKGSVLSVLGECKRGIVLYLESSQDQ